MELRECPFCKLKENLVIIQVKPIEYLRDDQNLEAIHCDNCDLTMHHPDKKMMYYRWNLRDTPKHETVEQWEKRTGQIYPDDGPVWVHDEHMYNSFKGKHPDYPYWILREYCIFKSSVTEQTRLKWKNGKLISIVANEHGKPEGN